MRPAEYQEADIIKAGQKLQREGRTVTVFGIRNTLGGGNPRRIGEIWSQYIANEKQGQTNQTEGNDATALAMLCTSTARKLSRPKQHTLMVFTSLPTLWSKKNCVNGIGKTSTTLSEGG